MRFVKDISGLTEFERAKVKVFDNKEDFQAALARGELAEDDLFAIRVTNGIFEDISEQLAEVRSVIPNNASPANLLVTQSDLDSGDLDALTARITAAEGDISNLNTSVGLNTSSIQQIGQVIPASASSSNQLVTASQLTSSVTSISNDVTTLASRVSDTETAVTTNACHIVELSNHKVEDSEFCSCFDSLDDKITANLNLINGKVDCSDYNTAMTTLNATVYNNTQGITDLNSCPGLSCVGTLTAADLTNKADCTCTNSLDARVTVNETDISNLKTCAGLTCTGTLTSSNFTLSGSKLTITF